MLRSVLLLALAVLTVVGGGMHVWAGEMDPVAVEAPVSSDTPPPGDGSFGEEADEEEAVAAAGAPASTQRGVRRSTSIAVATQVSVPPVPPPR